jgi:hypothetical protein
MFARRVIEHLRKDADHLSAEFIQTIKGSENCGELLRRVPAAEQRQSTRDIYRHLTDWLQGEPKKKEKYYVALGMRRAEQGVPFHELLSVIFAAREYFWDYVERETLLDAPVDFWGGVKLMRSLNACFDNALYYTSVGYQEISTQHYEHAVTPAEK